MHNKLRFLMLSISIVLMLYCGTEMINNSLPEILDKQGEVEKLKLELTISPSDYKKMVDSLDEKREEMYEQINSQTDTIDSIEKTMAFLFKEDILLKVSDAIKDTGASFDNFYVTHEGKIKNDYSVQVKGNIYQINQFIENMFIGTPGISIGEFSIRENDETSYLNRYFDNSNALMWYDGTLYKVKFKEEITEEEKEKVKEEIINKLPESDKIIYTMTLTFRV